MFVLMHVGTPADNIHTGHAIFEHMLPAPMPFYAPGCKVRGRMAEAWIETSESRHELYRLQLSPRWGRAGRSPCTTATMAFRKTDPSRSISASFTGIGW